jgi:hypothetical protein
VFQQQEKHAVESVNCTLSILLETGSLKVFQNCSNESLASRGCLIPHNSFYFHLNLWKPQRKNCKDSKRPGKSHQE